MTDQCRRHIIIVGSCSGCQQARPCFLHTHVSTPSALANAARAFLRTSSLKVIHLGLMEKRNALTRNCIWYSSQPSWQMPTNLMLLALSSASVSLIVG